MLAIALMIPLIRFREARKLGRSYHPPLAFATIDRWEPSWNSFNSTKWPSRLLFKAKGTTVAQWQATTAENRTVFLYVQT